MTNSTTPTWFERVYVEAEERGAPIPWAQQGASPDLLAWLDANNVSGDGRPALVVGCGLGHNAEALARRGFTVTAFDIAPTAIKMCRDRYPDSEVTYKVANLFALPASWQGRFAFVLELFNVQALPPLRQRTALQAIGRLVAPGGTLLLIGLGCDERDETSGPPWPLLKADVAALGQSNLQPVTFEEYHRQPDTPIRRFRVQFRMHDEGHSRGAGETLGYTHEIRAALAEFEATYPAYTGTRIIDELRARDYDRLDAQNHVYLDYTGGSLYSARQLAEHQALLINGIYGNPHSHNSASAASTALVEEAREQVLDYFAASPDDYFAIFTPNATGALKLVAEAYPFTSGSRYTLIFDNHNSVNGIREFAHSRGATVTYVPIRPPELRVDEAALLVALEQAQEGAAHLFAYPAQSNFSGVQHPLSWVEAAQRRGWDVFLDASAYVPTNRLDLSRWRPDFVSVSFYKIFGYPTGVGCLIARKQALAKLDRPWFAGGAVVLSSVLADAHHLADDEAGFEDGTVNYLSIPAVTIGLRHIASVGIETIQRRVQCLTAWLLVRIQALRHSNNRPLAVIYGPTTSEARGGAIAFNLYDRDGRLFDYRRVEELANEAQLSLRTGCFCNPGLAEVSGALTREEMAAAFGDGRQMTHREFVLALRRQTGKNSGAIRVSLGLVSNFADVYRLLHFLQSFQDRTVDDIGEVEIESVNCRILTP